MGWADMLCLADVLEHLYSVLVIEWRRSCSSSTRIRAAACDRAKCSRSVAHLHTSHTVGPPKPTCRHSNHAQPEADEQKLGCSDMPRRLHSLPVHRLGMSTLSDKLCSACPTWLTRCMSDVAACKREPRDSSYQVPGTQVCHTACKSFGQGSAAWQSRSLPFSGTQCYQSKDSQA